MIEDTFNLEKKEDGTINFTLIIPKDKVKKAYNKTLSITTQKAELKGFRKGKAPASLVEKEIGKQKLLTQTLQQILPEFYIEAVKKLKLQPISNPKIEPEKLDEDSDWKLKVTTAEKPQISLGNYKKIASDALAATKIWVPGKDTSSKDSTAKKDNQPKSSTDEKLSKVFDALIKNIQFKLPEFLIEEEITRQLSQLIQQIQRLGLTVDQYLASLNKTSQELRREYRDQADRNLRLEFILNEIAIDLKIAVDEKEVDKLIDAVGDQKVREKLQTPSERVAIKSSIRKRKVVDFLINT